MIRRPLDMFVQEIEPQNDQVHGAPSHIHVVGEGASAHVSMKMAQIAWRQVIDNLVAKQLFEADDGVPCWPLRAARRGWLAVQRMIYCQDEGLFIGFDGTDAHDGIPCERPTHSARSQDIT